MNTILLVDDNDEFRTMLSEVLTGAGYQVQEASDGEQAIRLYESQPTDMVTTDLVTPKKEGLKMIAEFKRLYSDSKIIAITGSERRGSEASLKMAEALGAQRVLAKPFSQGEILDMIGQVLKA